MFSLKETISVFFWVVAAAAALGVGLSIIFLLVGLTFKFLGSGIV